MIEALKNNRLHYTYTVICLLNYLTILFVGGVSWITLQRIIDLNQARAFLDTIQFLPHNAQTELLFGILGFSFLMGVVYFRRKINLDQGFLILGFILEIVLCMLVMKSMMFSSNCILLLVMADCMTFLPTNRSKIGLMLVLFILYLVSTYDVMSSFYSMISLEEILSVYTPVARSFLAGIKHTLDSLNILVFLMYIFFLIQDTINENKRFIALNDELSHLNQQLREYADIREKMGETKERNRLAREIHDTLGHTLTGISVGLDACEVMLTKNPEAARKQMKLLSESARNGLKDVRRSVDKLKPDALEKFTLQEALEFMIEEFESVTDVKIHYMCHLPRLNLDQDEQEVVYRIIQEGLTNAVRHGAAKKIYISIARERDNLLLIMEDDGKGCKYIKEGFGLNHMKERVELLHGNVRFYGTQGFIVIAEIPVREGV